MTDLAATPATPRPPARDWPTPDEPDYEPRDDRGDDDYSPGRDYSYPIDWQGRL